MGREGRGCTALTAAGLGFCSSCCPHLCPPGLPSHAPASVICNPIAGLPGRAERAAHRPPGGGGQAGGCACIGGARQLAGQRYQGIMKDLLMGQHGRDCLLDVEAGRALLVSLAQSSHQSCSCSIADCGGRVPERAGLAEREGGAAAADRQGVQRWWGGVLHVAWGVEGEQVQACCWWMVLGLG